jgi:ABC-type lipoprotein export system ATPase subunit/ABC-type antimicrobial peptide transport system permease subunit
MIKLNNINKYFNKRKNNEVHVINNTSLELPSTGLVCLLGASGSGKTTLLNVIGGLDKASGEIIYDDARIKRYNMAKVDRFRRKNMGYIFQNYYLFPDMTVYENLKFALSLANIFDKDEIEKRINYCLTAVNMINYKKRKASALSGGQQQRVAIARALVKKAKIIIADEPTGNLDSNNTVEIMNIIKKISETCLVILVTHERNIASFYADRIIEIKDGKVIEDFINTDNASFKHYDNRVVYLKDLNQDSYSENNYDLKLYYDNPLDEKLDINVIYKDGSFIVDVKSNKKVKYQTPNSDIVIKDEHYKEIAKSDIENYHYDNSSFKDVIGKKNVLKKLWHDFKLAFSKFYFVNFRHKLIYAGFIIVGMLSAYTVANYSNTFSYNEKAYISSDRSVVTILNPELEQLDIEEILADDSVINIAYYNDKFRDFSVEVGNSYQTKYQRVYSYNEISAISLEVVNESELFIGELPTKYNEVALDIWVADTIVSGAKSIVGEFNYNDLIGKKFKYDNNSTRAYEFTITGIINRKANVIALTPGGYINFGLIRTWYLNNRNDIQIYDAYPELQIIEGRAPINDGEILINERHSIAIGDQVNKVNTNIPLNKTYTVVGKYTSATMVNNNFVTYNDAVEFSKYAIGKTDRLNIYSSNKEKTEKLAKDLGLSFVDVNANARDRYIKNQLNNLLGVTIFTSILGVGIIIYVFFMMRSKMISRIYDIGVYRALGASRWKVTSIFLMELLILTTFTSILGYSFVTYIILYINNALKDFGQAIILPWYNIVLGGLLIYGINIFFGLLPIILLQTKTPSQILTKYDI